MVTYLITDDPKLLLGFRLQGALGVVVKDTQEALRAYKNCISNDTIGIVVLTDSLYQQMQDDVIRHIRTGKKPLTVTLPANK